MIYSLILSCFLGGIEWPVIWPIVWPVIQQCAPRETVDEPEQGEEVKAPQPKVKEEHESATCPDGRCSTVGRGRFLLRRWR